LVKELETVVVINRTFDLQLPMGIRLATLADAGAVSQLVNQSYRGQTGVQGWTTESHLLKGLRTDSERVARLIIGADSVLMLKSTDEQLEGCVHLERKGRSTAYLGMLTTHFRGQSKGVCSELLRAAETFAKVHWQVERIEMTVITMRTELIEWYVRRGYSVTTERRPFPTDPRFGIPLVENLEFVVLEKVIS